MNELQQEERQRARRQLTERSIELAMKNSWEEAAEANRRLVAQFDPDVEAWNRLGKAYAELGRIADARGAYSHALTIEPANAIAQRNNIRLSHIKDTHVPVARDHHDSVDARFFIEETGKTVARSMFTSVPQETLANLSVGDRLLLAVQKDLILVSMVGGTALGFLDGKLSGRLVGLIEGGNEYAAAVVRIEGRYVRLMIREVYQAPLLTGRVSFPPETTSNFRPYTKDSLLRQDRLLEDEEDLFGGADVDGDEGADTDDPADPFDDSLDG